MPHIYGLLVRSSAILATLELGFLGLPTHTYEHMGIVLTRLCLSTASSTMACRIRCKVLTDLTKFSLSSVCRYWDFRREVTVVMDPFEYFVVAQMITDALLSQCRCDDRIGCNFCISMWKQ